MSESNNIWVQLGTRLHMLVYNVQHKQWEVWTSTNNRSGDSSKWLGTYLLLHADGKCEQHHRSETEVTSFVVREGTTQCR